MVKSALVTQEMIGDTFIVRMNSVSITEEFLDALNSTLDDIEFLRKYNNINGSLKSIIFISSVDNIFLAGADLKLMYKSLGNEKALSALIQRGHDTFNRIAKIDVPTIAAINGACLGGGYELALACDYRIATNNKSTKIGLPEVNLGILPAWGGTTRLPRLIGVVNALKVILGGAQNPSKYAKKLGLVDNVVHTENLEKFCLSLSYQKLSKPKLKSFFLKPVNWFIFNQAKKNVLKKTAGNYPAPIKIINVIKKSLSTSIEKSLELEKEAFLELSSTKHCKNLIRIFFLQEGCKKLKWNNITTDKNINSVCVAGAGTMGAGIAQWLSSRGLKVTLRDINEQIVSNGLKTIGDLFVQAVRGHKIDRPSARNSLSNLYTSIGDKPLKSQDLVIEAIIENMDVKKKVLADLESKVNKNCIIATNTSALSVDEMAESLSRPENFIGIHFFNPVHKMKLVEIVVGKKTSDETIARTIKFVQKISKFPIVVKDSPGFVVNRILIPYLIEAAKLYEQGIIPQEIDKAIVKWGMPMGPYRLMDEIGIDVCMHVSKDLSSRLGYDLPDVLDKMVKENKLGKKTGEGFYKYKKGRSVKEKYDHSPVGELSHNTALLTGAMIQEAQKVLSEQIVYNADDIDFGMIMGTGFAPFKGGPINYFKHL